MVTVSFENKQEWIFKPKLLNLRRIIYVMFTICGTCICRTRDLMTSREGIVVALDPIQLPMWPNWTPFTKVTEIDFSFLLICPTWLLPMCPRWDCRNFFTNMSASRLNHMWGDRRSPFSEGKKNHSHHGGHFYVYCTVVVPFPPGRHKQSKKISIYLQNSKFWLSHKFWGKFWTYIPPSTPLTKKFAPPLAGSKVAPSLAESCYFPLSRRTPHPCMVWTTYQYQAHGWSLIMFLLTDNILCWHCDLIQKTQDKKYHWRNSGIKMWYVLFWQWLQRLFEQFYSWCQLELLN